MSTLEPISSCFNPTHFFNKSLGKDFLVPCGKCLYCRTHKDSKYSMLSTLEMQNNKYALFFTLTYDNENVPCYYFSDDSYSYSKDFIRVYSNRDGSSLDIFTRDFNNFKTSVFNIPRGAAFPFVSRSDVQKFLKRLRINIVRTLKRNVQIRYLITAEYGPKTFRPHYHGIIYFNDSDLLTKTTVSHVLNTSLLSALIAKSWPFADYCRTAKYATIVDGGASNYVSSYASSSCNLPRFLQYPETRPFTPAHSTRFGFSASQKAEIYQNVSNGDYQLHRTDVKTKNVTHVPISSQNRSRLFPRFPLYSRLPAQVQQYLLSVCSGQSYHVAKAGFSLFENSLYDTYLIKQLSFLDASNFFNRADRPPTLFSLLDFCKAYPTYESIVNSLALTPAIKHVFIACRNFMVYCRKTSDDFYRCCDGLTRFTSLQILKQFYQQQQLYIDNGYKKTDWFYILDFWRKNSDLVRLRKPANTHLTAYPNLSYFGSSLFSEHKQSINSLIVNKMRVKSHNDTYKFNNLLKSY